MPSSMIEKAARALRDQFPSLFKNSPVSRREAIVRAVLLAVREADEELEDTLQASLDCVPINRCVQQSQQVWRNGIDHILGDGGDG